MVGRRAVRHIIGGGFWFLAFWREAKASISKQVDSSMARTPQRSIMSSYLKKYIFYAYIYAIILYTTIYVCILGGLFEIFVFKPSCQISEFKCTALRDDSGKPLKTVVQRPGQKKMYKKRCIIIMMRLVFRANLQFMSFSKPKKIREISHVIARVRSLILNACLNVNLFTL